MAEVSVGKGYAQVLKVDGGGWAPQGGVALLQVYHNTSTNTYRAVGMDSSRTVVLNAAIHAGLNYKAASPTFHQWQDPKGVYGFNFKSADDATSFQEAVQKAMNPGRPAAAPRPPAISAVSASPVAPTPPPAPSSPSVAPPPAPAAPAAPPPPSAGGAPRPPPAPAAPAAPPAPPAPAAPAAPPPPPSGGGPPPPPPPGPPSAPRPPAPPSSSSDDDSPSSGNPLAAALAAAKLKRAANAANSPAPSSPAPPAAAPEAPAPKKAGGGMSMMEEMAARLSKKGGGAGGAGGSVRNNPPPKEDPPAESTDSSSESTSGKILPPPARAMPSPPQPPAPSPPSAPQRATPAPPQPAVSAPTPPQPPSAQSGGTIGKNSAAISAVLRKMGQKEDSAPASEDTVPALPRISNAGGTMRGLGNQPGSIGKSSGIGLLLEKESSFTNEDEFRSKSGSISSTHGSAGLFGNGNTGMTNEMFEKLKAEVVAAVRDELKNFKSEILSALNGSKSQW
ncbi:hypothetical protein BKA69DRAFT_1127086 [Paraphysoderma sedebokerense]|nr:hypothetical protein BKA69DRAFT_1127086 [Paraphysoderma sedebokerense]